MIGYYVHHHGSGHRVRYEAIAPWLGAVVPISELALPGGLTLPSDVPATPPDDSDAGGALHWAPLHRGASTRLRMLADWLESHEPSGVVIDVSIETALVCRLAGVPTVMVRQLGQRTDPAHELGYRIARRLLAPWPRELEDDESPAWITDKTDYTGYLSNELPAAPGASEHPSAVEVTPEDVVVLWGSGGGQVPTCAIQAIAAQCGGTVWCVGADFVGGRTAVGGCADNVSVLGWHPEIDSILRAAPVTVASAGNNVIAAAARRSCPLILIPQCRPFGEQHAHARRLGALGAAIVVEDPDLEQRWSDLIAGSRRCGQALGALYRPGGARRAADVVLRTFEDGGR